MEYVTVAEARAELGEALADKSDAAILRMIDRLASVLEDGLGHTFGRALLARSDNPAHTVRVTANALEIGGDAYAFADHMTLGALAAAVTGAGKTYTLEVLPRIDPRTPSTSLAVRAEMICGGGYENRQILDVIHLYVALSGRATPAVYLPLPAYEIVSVTEDGVILSASGYALDETRLVLWRRQCACTTVPCPVHGCKKWSARTPENIIVLYMPRWWRQPPAACASAILEGLTILAGGGPLESETFGPYTYRRSLPAPKSWQQVLTDSALNQYRTRMVIVY